MRGLGRHLIIDFSGCSPNLLNDEEALKKILRKAAEEANVKIHEEIFIKFKPQGVSCIAAIAESHISIHTWPEFDYAAIDIFTCGDKADPWKAYVALEKSLRPEKSSVFEVKRGVIPT